MVRRGQGEGLTERAYGIRWGMYGLTAQHGKSGGRRSVNLNGAMERIKWYLVKELKRKKVRTRERLGFIASK